MFYPQISDIPYWALLLCQDALSFWQVWIITNLIVPRVLWTSIDTIHAFHPQLTPKQRNMASKVSSNKHRLPSGQASSEDDDEFTNELSQNVSDSLCRNSLLVHTNSCIIHLDGWSQTIIWVRAMHGACLSMRSHVWGWLDVLSKLSETTLKVV